MVQTTCVSVPVYCVNANAVLQPVGSYSDMYSVPNRVLLFCQLIRNVITISMDSAS